MGTQNSWFCDLVIPYTWVAPPPPQAFCSIEVHVPLAVMAAVSPVDPACCEGEG